MAEVQNRIKNSNKVNYAILPLIKDRDISRKLRLILYKTLIRSILAYVGENWINTKIVESKLDCCERKILRRIYEPVKDRGIRRMRHSGKIYKLYDIPYSAKRLGDRL